MSTSSANAAATTSATRADTTVRAAQALASRAASAAVAGAHHGISASGCGVLRGWVGVPAEAATAARDLCDAG